MQKSKCYLKKGLGRSYERATNSKSFGPRITIEKCSPHHGCHGNARTHKSHRKGRIPRLDRGFVAGSQKSSAPQWPIRETRHAKFPEMHEHANGMAIGTSVLLSSAAVTTADLPLHSHTFRFPYFRTSEVIFPTPNHAVVSVSRKSLWILWTSTASGAV
jgi:hypothetical protein